MFERQIRTSIGGEERVDIATRSLERSLECPHSRPEHADYRDLGDASDEGRQDDVATAVRSARRARTRRQSIRDGGTDSAQRSPPPGTVPGSCSWWRWMSARCYWLPPRAARCSK